MAKPKPTSGKKTTPKARPQSEKSAPNPGGTNNNSYWKPVTAMLLVLGAVFFIYRPALQHDFTNWDDAVYVTENPLFLYPSAENKAAIWTQPVSLNYHPLTMYSLSMDYHASRPGALPPARPFIATNIMLHILNTLLVFFFAFLLSGRLWEVGVLCAAIFGIHPMHVESVAWISERKDVLYGFFFIAALISYLQYIRSKGLGWLALTLGLFVLSCLSKAMAVALPLVLVLIDYYEGRILSSGKLNVRAVIEKLPFFAISLVFGLMAFKIQSEGAISKFEVFSVFNRFVFASYGFVMYWYKFLVPFPLTTFYPYPDGATKGDLPAYFYAMPVLTLLILGAAVWSMRKTRLGLFSVGFYFATVAFVLQFVSVGVVIMADRYSYIPYIGVAFLLSMLFSASWRSELPSISRWRLPALFVTSTLLAVFFFRAQAQVGVWKNSETLWTNVLQYYPNATEAYKSRGNFYGKTGKIDAALADLQQAAAKGSRDAGVFNGLGNCYGMKNELDKAMEAYNQGIALNADNGELFFNRGITHDKKHQYAEAIADYQQALLYLPAKKYQIVSARGYAYLMNKQFAEAIADFDVILQLPDPTAELYHNRAIAKFNLKDYTGATKDLERAAQLAPNDANIQKNLGVLRGLSAGK
jgi:tetratricopeptide (TPR) repeat protein